MMEIASLYLFIEIRFDVAAKRRKKRKNQNSEPLISIGCKSAIQNF
jgi:hypothetical protein